MKHTWLNKKIAETDLKRIEDAVIHQEKRTSGEIIPMIVRSSSIGANPSFKLLLFFLVSCIAIDHFYREEWNILTTWYFSVAFFIAVIAEQIPFIQMRLTPKALRQKQAFMRAKMEFFDLEFFKTAERTGILLMVSLEERQAVVLADDGIAKKVDAKVWQETVDLMIEGAKNGELAQGFVRAIENCGNILAEHFPPKDQNHDELRNHLVVKE